MVFDFKCCKTSCFALKQQTAKLFHYQKNIKIFDKQGK